VLLQLLGDVSRDWSTTSGVYTRDWSPSDVLTRDWSQSAGVRSHDWSSSFMLPVTTDDPLLSKAQGSEVINCVLSAIPVHM